MKIADNPPGLISRRMFPIDQGRVCVEEHWDISASGCPMIQNPWLPPLREGNNYIRQVTMTEAEYSAAFPLFGQRATIDMADKPEPTIPELIAAIEAYRFECEAGPLENCVEWRELKRRLGHPTA